MRALRAQPARPKNTSRCVRLDRCVVAGSFVTVEEVRTMAKVLHCRDVGFDCAGIIRADSEEEVLKLAAEHAKTVHKLEELSAEVVAKVRAAIREEQPARTNA